VAAGTAVITVTSRDGNFKDSCSVTVIDDFIAVTGVSLTPKNINIKINVTETLTVNFTPTDATNKTITWESSRESVATVTNGVVMGVSAGTAVITVTTNDGSFKDSCSVTVSADYIAVTGVSLNKPALSLNVGGSETLTAALTPSDASNKNVNWSSSAPNIASVSPSGLVTAVSPGNATITVTTVDNNRTANCSVNVSLTLDGLESYLAILPINNASSPHPIALSIYREEDIRIIYSALRRSPNKFVDLDLTGSNVKSILSRAFNECSNLVNIALPNSLTSISDFAFGNCNSLVSIVRPNGVTQIEGSTFTNCSNLISVTLGNNVRDILEYAFYACSSLTTISLPDRLSYIGRAAFYECSSLTDISLPSDLSRIGFLAFSDCNSITNITFIGSVILEDFAFQSCHNLTSVTFLRTISSGNFDETAFSGNLRDVFYANSVNGTPGTYTRVRGSDTWTKQ
jgi:hypothetical protein